MSRKNPMLKMILIHKIILKFQNSQQPASNVGWIPNSPVDLEGLLHKLCQDLVEIIINGPGWGEIPTKLATNGPGWGEMPTKLASSGPGWENLQTHLFPIKININGVTCNFNISFTSHFFRYKHKQNCFHSKNQNTSKQNKQSYGWSSSKYTKISGFL